MNLTDGQKHVIGVVDAFCDEHFDERSIQQWCISRGMPTHVYDAFYESELGAYVLPISVGGKDYRVVGDYAEWYMPENTPLLWNKKVMAVWTDG